MTTKETQEHAKRIVLSMLYGRCSPEMDDVQDVEGESEKELVIQEIENVLDRLRKSLQENT